MFVAHLSGRTYDILLDNIAKQTSEAFSEGLKVSENGDFKKAREILFEGCALADVLYDVLTAQEYLDENEEDGEKDGKL